MFSRRNLFLTAFSVLLAASLPAQPTKAPAVATAKSASSAPVGQKKSDNKPAPSKPLSKEARLWLT